MLFGAPLLVLAALTANANDDNSAYTGTRPVLIAACSVEPDVRYPSSGTENPILPQTVGKKLNIKFANTTNERISSVTFAVRDGDNPPALLTDAGTFAPGETIAHSLESPISDTDHLGCSISAVRFEDGSTWMDDRSGAGR